jgi:hydroxypyruvate reductase
MTTALPASAAPRAFLRSLFDAAVAAAHPLAAMQAALPQRPKGRTIVVGAGKAASAMAEALESLWDGPLKGAGVSRHGATAKLERLQFLTSSHPVPDEAGLAASKTLLKLVEGLTADDLVIALISGGGSSLLPAPAAGLTLADEQELNRALLKSGAPIAAMNCIRKHISRIKGGRLALAAAPAKVVSFVVSDIPGDVLPLISSGPTLADATTLADCMAAIRDYDIALPYKLLDYLKTAPATPLPTDKAFARNEVHLVASAAVSLAAAKREAERHGLVAHVLSDAIEGESREVAKMHGNLAAFVQDQGQPFSRPCVILSGGETTVTIGSEGHGKGGRNGEFALSLAREIAGRDNIHALAADTDGIDGSETNAGAFADGGTWLRIRKAGLDPAALLKDHDSWTALQAAGDILVTGQTGTNVNDFRAILLV